MKAYPSILSSSGQTFREFRAHVFDKLDGSNLRWEWNKKQGWYKQGTRHRLFDATDLDYGAAIPLFQKTLAEPLAGIAVEHRWPSLIVFTEYWGPKSFVGKHVPGDEMRLTLFDVNPYKEGLMPPADFISLFGHLDIPKYFGFINWTRGFLKQVWENEIPGITFEGVVGKAKDGRHDLIMAKAKTKMWIEKVRANYNVAEAEKIINS